ncbi:hypothetical protein CVD25_17945 [Bacillus canaveralius]|uniref:Uncharacterized protein n=1 Tax=Bacillus canaveralius TaxID=1403243 RepID=A0A2N5GSS0_9BACI|nr:hypothetical protein [Bacillus canaveralius]PLR86817.1 hypothetical protein CU635_00560 [Bacillus canaveralius]PLR92722.1 hypothetical protein CVD25_17945 [Bacillus canaveralius]RSK55651.1 hypothetical protein EJA13_03030 [Bacillus canaveralius]
MKKFKDEVRLAKMVSFILTIPIPVLLFLKFEEKFRNGWEFVPKAAELLPYPFGAFLGYTIDFLVLWFVVLIVYVGVWQLGTILFSNFFKMFYKAVNIQKC